MHAHEEGRILTGCAIFELIIIGLLTPLLVSAWMGERRTDATRNSDMAMRQQHIKLADVTDPAEFRIVETDATVPQFQCSVVPETHYLRQKKTGKIFAQVIRCITCNKDIPLFPYGPGADPKALAPTYKCPLCHGRALGAPAPRSAQPD